MRAALTLLTALLLSATASGVLILEDPAGDVTMASYDVVLDAPYDWAAVDMVAIEIDETEESFLWTVEIAGVPTDAAGNCPDSGDLRSFFRYGNLEYNVQQGRDVTCAPYALLWETLGSDFNRRLIGPLDVEAADTRITATIPRELIVDDSGAPPIAGREFTNIRARSFSMASLGGPDISDPFSPEEGDLLVVNDNVPDTAVDDDAGGTYRILSGGSRSEGDIRMWSDHPFRASNGGSGVHAFALNVENMGAPTDVMVLLIGTPESWRVSPPAALTLGTGERATLTVAVETPSGHQHGGTDRFVARADTAAGHWAEADLGIHYLDVPQPAGHHPTLFLHPQPWEQANPFVTNFVGGDGDLWMDTLSEPREGAGPVQGFQDFIGEPRVSWPICLSGDLRLGLDFDLGREGAFIGSFTATKPYLGATLGGTLYQIKPGPAYAFCHPFFMEQREFVELATLAPVDLGDVQGSFGIDTPVTALVDDLPLEPGSTLMLELWVEHGLVSTPGGSGITLDPGASLDLPLLEYITDAPIGLIGGDAVVDDVDPDVFEPADVDEVEDSPAGLLLIPLAGLAAIAWRRR